MVEEIGECARVFVDASCDTARVGDDWLVKLAGFGLCHLRCIVLVSTDSSVLSS